MRRYCKNCGQISQADTDLKNCPHCGAEFEPVGIPREEQPQGSGLPPLQPMARQTAGGSEAKYCPWEDKGRLGFVGALYETWKESLFNPTSFFRKLPVTGGIGNPLLYGLILGMIGVIFSIMYSQFWSNVFDFSRLAPYMGSDFDMEAYNFASQMQSIGMLVKLVISPFVILIGFFIAAGIFHLILLIFGWNKENFEATFRIIAYSESAYFFEIVPFFGGLVSMVWAVVLYVIGLKEVHKLTIGQSLLVVFLPLILICLCCCGALAMIFGVIGMNH